MKGIEKVLLDRALSTEQRLTKAFLTSNLRRTRRAKWAKWVVHVQAAALVEEQLVEIFVAVGRECFQRSVLEQRETSAVRLNSLYSPNFHSALPSPWPPL